MNCPHLLRESVDILKEDNLWDLKSFCKYLLLKIKFGVSNFRNKKNSSVDSFIFFNHIMSYKKYNIKLNGKRHNNNEKSLSQRQNWWEY